MKTKNYLILFLISIMGTIECAHGQNSIWSLPPYYVENNAGTIDTIPLPTVSPPALGYYGDPATTVSNAMQDANGDLLFFIVDGEIYDKEGYTIGILDFAINTSLSIKGTAEVAIAPVPGNCAQYYIIMAGRNSYTNSLSSKLPVIALLDMSVPSSINGDRLGEIVYGATIKEILPIGAPDIDIDEQGKQGSSYFAVSRESNGRRFVFISNPENIFRFIVDNTGFHYDGFIPVTFDAGNNDLGFRGEMELVEVNSNGDVKYRLAFYLPYVPPIGSGHLSANVVYIYNLDNNGYIAIDNNGMDKYYLPYENSSQVPLMDRAYIHGLEFSPNGEILYITHQANSDYPSAFDFFDFNNISAGIQSVPGVSLQEALNFEYSQIEIGKSGNLYLAYSGGLATFSNPNNPSLGTLNLNALSFNYEANREGDPGNDIRLKSYVLPDQIDGMNYSGIGYPATHSVQSYTATVSGVWQSGSNPWNNTSAEILVHENLIIPSGRNITIKNMTFRFAPDAKVIIEQGAKLTIDKSVFTSSGVECEIGNRNFWGGIQVYGTTNQHQYPTLNPTYQGMLVVTNGGVIENANRGVTNWNEGNWHEIGGVIQVTDGVFRNNRKDVEFIAYQNFDPSNPSIKRDNTSFFKDTDFISDDDFIEKGLAILPHVTLWDVNGISFQNCHFANEVTDKENTSAPHRAIYSVDAGYSVLARCTTIQPIGVPCPTANLLRSSFKGFKNAIEATGAGTSETVTIQQAEFIDNVWDISIDEFDNVSINRNEIVTGNTTLSPIFPIGVGVNISNSTGFLVEENTISTSLTNGYSLGISVTDGGTDDNRLYKNNLEELTFGLYGNGINHNSNYQKGLQFLCNSLTNNQEAIRISSNVTTDGVRFYQGEYSPKKSAGNTFANNTMDISNLSNSIVYMHNGGNTEPLNYQGLITLEGSSSVNNCPSSFGGLILMGGDLALDSLGSRLDDLTTSYNDLNFVYTSLIDDGNTEEFKDNIELNWSSDAWLLRGKLLESSPYLSSEVLLEAAKQNVLPNGMLLEILLANPDATRSERFVEELKMVTQNSFPEYMLDYVRGNWDNRTLRTDMEGQLSSIHSELSNTRNWIKHLTKTKEEYKYEDRLNVVKLGDEIYSKVGLIDFFIENNEFNKADSVLNVIQNDKKYRHDLLLIENFGEYINFRSSLDNRNLAQLDSTEIAYLQDLAEYNGRVAGYAQNILCFFYDICFEKELVFEEPKTKSNMVLNSKSEELNNILYNVNIYPNPAADYTSIQWEIFDELRDAHYRVLDLNGRELLTGALTSNKGEEIIDTRKLEQGVYIIGIYNNQKLMVNKKLVVEGRE